MRFLQKDTEQYHVCLGGAGIARDDERRFALRVLEGVLGGTSSSRLFQEVRERRGPGLLGVHLLQPLCEHRRGRALRRHAPGEPARGARGGRAPSSSAASRIPPASEELIRSRENLKGRVVLALESTGARMSRLGASVLDGLPILSVDEMIERIDAVEHRRAAGAGRRAVRAERLSVAGVGPDEERFRAAIEPLRGRR